MTILPLSPAVCPPFVRSDEITVHTQRRISAIRSFRKNLMLMQPITLFTGSRYSMRGWQADKQRAYARPVYQGYAQNEIPPAM